MTVEQIKKELDLIRQIRKNDISQAREQWLALRDRVRAYCKVNKLPEKWREHLENELNNI